MLHTSYVTFNKPKNGVVINFFLELGGVSSNVGPVPSSSIMELANKYHMTSTVRSMAACSTISEKFVKMGEKQNASARREELSPAVSLLPDLFLASIPVLSEKTIHPCDLISNDVYSI